MTDRPIIFSGPMIRALLDGRKTQTRRVLKPWRGMQAEWLTMKLLHSAPTCYVAEVGGRLGVQMQHPHAGTTQHYGDVDEMSPLTWVRLPYQIGDRLWVREAHYLTDDGENEYAVFAAEKQDVEEHLANMQTTMASHPNIDWSKHLRLRPPIHMPRWASRLTLTVTDVRVQRLQDISAEDCAAEGIKISDGALLRDGYMLANRKDFRHLWNSLHGPDAWDRNDWVAAYTFTVEQRNIDA